MKNAIQINQIIPSIKNSQYRSPWWRGFLLIALALAWLALSPTARAVTPAPDGGYLGGNTAEGDDALFSLQLLNGFDNTAIGLDALYSATDSIENTAVGSQALFYNTSGQNTAIGAFSLFNNTTGYENTATGDTVLINNTTGHENTATGFEALYSNTAGVQNTANGVKALFYNTGSYNTANGFGALYNNTIGIDNTAAGIVALFNNTTGAQNTATGSNALSSNTIGGQNTATGENALVNNTTGSSNIALGFQAGVNLTTGSNNIDIGNAGVAGESKRIRIGTAGTQTKTFIAGISGVTVASGVGVIVGSNGQLGTVVSSERYKDAIKPMEKASEAILALKPVTFRYKHELDPDGIPQFGLVAEQVEKVNPALVARDDQGKPYTVRYDAVNAMLLNEFLKEHRKVEEQDRKVGQQAATITQVKSTVAKQEATIAQQQKEIKALTASLKEQASQIQKVSAQLEVTKPAPQMVLNNQ